MPINKNQKVLICGEGDNIECFYIGQTVFAVLNPNYQLYRIEKIYADDTVDLRAYSITNIAKRELPLNSRAMEMNLFKRVKVVGSDGIVDLTGDFTKSAVYKELVKKWNDNL
ncbi:MAG: hypothetical protein GWN00_21645 [Aliifodinibius sp.]|nr:hypothetical protein [Fodinibius sp.]NIY27311.1 hypothetical protein [Fodinibius sp.]